MRRLLWPCAVLISLSALSYEMKRRVGLVATTLQLVEAMSLHAAGDGGVHTVPSSSRALGDARQQRHERRLVLAGQGAAAMTSQHPQYFVPYSCSLTYIPSSVPTPSFALTVDKLWSPRRASPPLLLECSI